MTPCPLCAQAVARSDGAGRPKIFCSDECMRLSAAIRNLVEAQRGTTLNESRGARLVEASGRILED
jgi:hypothetical protein